MADVNELRFLLDELAEAEAVEEDIGLRDGKILAVVWLLAALRHT